ncbi:MAG: F0F1 ATP synthase subunit delta [Planctomycetes bacterium]|nr:F0F1 ATP synthase subunit delta [Planctomycetota bacterium]
MLIDWFTVGAQALNFIVLVWLLKHFLYKRVLAAIDARELLIAGKLAGADAKMVEADKERDDFHHKNADLDQRRAALMSGMEADAKAERLRLLDEARKAADALSATRQESIRVDAQNLNLAIGQRIQQEVFAVARRALKDLSTANLEHSVADLFMRRVREMDGNRKQQLAEALKTSTGPATLRSAFALTTDQRAAMQQALNETLSADIRIDFQVAPDLIGGIEFVVNGQKVSWNIAEYLTSLQGSVDNLLKLQTAPPAHHEAQPAAASKPEPKPEGKPETKSGDTPEAKAEAKPEDKPETKSADSSEVKPEANPASKPEEKSAAKPEAKPETTAESHAAPPPTGDPVAPGSPAKPGVAADPSAATVADEAHAHGS